MGKDNGTTPVMFKPRMVAGIEQTIMKPLFQFLKDNYPKNIQLFSIEKSNADFT